MARIEQNNFSELHDKCVIIFTRYPITGITKTRLIPALGPENASKLQKKMAEFVFKECKNTAGSLKKTSIEIHHQGGEAEKVRAWTPESITCRRQYQGSMGEKLFHAFKQGFESGRKKIIIIGTDCPFINKKIISHGFKLLTYTDIVLGPALDGGYYLIGLKSADEDLFRNIDWGTEKVMTQTIAKALQKNKTWKTLPILADIDRPEDLQLIKLSDFNI